MSDTAHVQEKGGVHYVRHQFGIPLKFGDGPTAFRVSQIINRAFEAGQNDVRQAIKDILCIEETPHD